MKIREVRTRVAQWSGETTPLPPHFCTNPMDLLTLPQSSMNTFTFHSWLVVEVMTDDGLVGLGNAALAPIVTKSVIDHYLKPLLLGADPWDIEFLWQHMYRKTMAFGRKGIGMTAMRERAELLEGTFEVLRPGEGGTLVRLDVPLTDTYEQ